MQFRHCAGQYTLGALADADYELVAELHDLKPDLAAGGFRPLSHLRTAAEGYALPTTHDTISEGRLVLWNEGHRHRVIVGGKVMSLLRLSQFSSTRWSFRTARSMAGPAGITRFSASFSRQCLHTSANP
jgi:hypothetical protein